MQEYLAPGGDGWSFADFQREPLLFFLEPYRKLGPVFRVDFDGVPTTVMAGPESNELFMRERDLWSYRKAFSFIAHVIEQDLIALDAPAHGAKRQRMLPSFRLEVLDRQAGELRAALTELLTEREGADCDLRDLMNLAFFRQASRALGMTMEDEIFDAVLEAEKYILQGTAFDAGDGQLASQAIATFAVVTDKIRPHLEARLGRQGDEDMLTVMASAHSASGALPARRELEEDVAVLLLAGVENGAHIILWALLLLHHNPEWEAQVRAELSALPVGDELSPVKAPKLHATIFEAERLRPPFPILPRVAVRDFELGGIVVPARDPIIHALTLVHFLDELYADPLEFHPERHLGSRQLAKLHTAFGMGPHRCIGMPQSRHQAAITLREVLLDWDIEYQFEPSLGYSMEAAVTPIEARLPVSLTRRRRSASERGGAAAGPHRTG